MRNKFLFVLVLLAFVACAPMSKESYMEQYSEFVNEVSMNASSYTKNDWEKQDKMFQKYSEEWYDKFQADFTASDKIVLAGYKVKYSYYRVINKLGDWALSAINSIDLDSVSSIVMGVGNRLLDGSNQVDGDVVGLDMAINLLWKILDATMYNSVPNEGVECAVSDSANAGKSLDDLLAKIDSVLDVSTSNK